MLLSSCSLILSCCFLAKHGCGGSATHSAALGVILLNEETIENNEGRIVVYEGPIETNEECTEINEERTEINRFFEWIQSNFINPKMYR